MVAELGVKTRYINVGIKDIESARPIAQCHHHDGQQDRPHQNVPETIFPKPAQHVDKQRANNQGGKRGLCRETDEVDFIQGWDQVLGDCAQNKIAQKERANTQPSAYGINQKDSERRIRSHDHFQTTQNF